MQPHRRRILCVVQDSETCSLINSLLRESGFEAKSASTIGEALQLAGDERFDLYLLELRLADGSGIELCRQIRRFDPDAPITFFADVVRKRNRQQAVMAGAQGYLSKPHGIYKLAEVITRLSSGHDI